jgi:hypothetical protein
MNDEEIKQQIQQYLKDDPKVNEILKQFNIDFKQYAAFINQMSTKPITGTSTTISQQ